MHLLKKIILLASLFTSIAVAEPKLIQLKKGDLSIDVFGTIHVAKPDFYPLPKSIMSRFKQADALAVELDITDKKLISESTAMITAFQVPKTVLDEKRLKKLRENIGDAAEGLKLLKPVMIAMLLDYARASNYGYTELGIDATMIYQALDNMPILSLETVADTLTLFQNVSDEEGLAIFDYALKAGGEKSFKQAEQIWRNNNTEVAKKLHDEMTAVAPNLTKGLLTLRNQKMAKRILKFNEKYPHLFVAIGAMHLYGKDSVIEELLKNGYTRVE